MTITAAGARRGALALLAVLVLSSCAGQEVEVTGSVGSERIEAYEAMSQSALDQVEDLWGEGSVERPVGVMLPATSTEFAELTGGASASHGAPAVTVGRLEQAHIVVHPDSWGLLTPEGRQAVLTHEVAHLSQQGDGPVPSWMGEGLAEYTAHRDSALRPATIAGSALDDVRAGQLPTDWPDPGADGSTSTDSTSPDSAWGGYALSWLACLYIAETWSEEELVAFYDAVASGVPVSEAIPEVLGISESEALAGWSAWLVEIAAG